MWRTREDEKGELYRITVEVYSEPCEISEMKHFEKLINGYFLLTIFVKLSILDVWKVSEDTSEKCK